MRDTGAQIVRRSIDVRGVVQGVGFRPFVYGLATELRLGGFVLNREGRVAIEIEGAEGAVASFLGELRAKAPPLARIEDIVCAARPPCGEAAFRIETSEPGGEQSPGGIVVAADVATCADCVKELFDPADRRYRYPFVNCTHCGPRLTLVEDAPYDRARTTMASFVMCARCRAEYEDPRDRRFHAQPIACPDCGPQLRALDRAGRSVQGDALAFAATALRAGRILAVKGLGGYHLVCRANDAAAIAELRRRKGRDEQPFAVMVRDGLDAGRHGFVSAQERATLESDARPIVLLRRRPEAAVADAVAPGQARLGVMLPHTPLHHCLFADLEDEVLVMTSGNRHAEPMAFEDADALERLAGVADAFLVHDRPIRTRCDDSVAIVVPESGACLPVRRSRGHAPLPVSLPFEVKTPTLAVGGHLKSTFALAFGRHAFISHHLGDLHEALALDAYRDAVGHYERLFRLMPERIAHDAHPDYASTREALDHPGRAIRVPVQHHHAHLASCMADCGLSGRVIGVCFDGAGLGDDGALWGGEFLMGGYAGARRLGHLSYVAMPGGDAASREPWRMAVSHAMSAGIDPTHGAFGRRVGRDSIAAMTTLIEKRAFCPSTSSIGRLFDAVASIAGLCDRSSFEGQAAMRLEAAADADEPGDPYSYEIHDGATGWVLDPTPLVRQAWTDAERGAGPGVIASRFHVSLARATADICVRIRAREGLDDVVLSGGVFVNARLSALTTSCLTRAGFRVHRHREVPPNDGGLCLGQIAVAAALDAHGEG
jgi:hydrogenase maturation protein HypF